RQVFGPQPLGELLDRAPRFGGDARLGAQDAGALGAADVLVAGRGVHQQQARAEPVGELPSLLGGEVRARRQLRAARPEIETYQNTRDGNHAAGVSNLRASCQRTAAMLYAPRSEAPMDMRANTTHLDIATDGVELSREEIERYSRHLILPEVGLEG